MDSGYIALPFTRYNLPTSTVYQKYGETTVRVQDNLPGTQFQQPIDNAPTNTKPLEQDNQNINTGQNENHNINYTNETNTRVPDSLSTETNKDI